MRNEKLEFREVLLKAPSGRELSSECETEGECGRK